MTQENGTWTTGEKEKGNPQLAEMVCMCMYDKELRKNELNVKYGNLLHSVQ
jgi:hypothetical protein